MALSIQQKLKIIEQFEKGENCNSIMSEYNISSTTIYGIKKQKLQSQSFVLQSASVKNLESRQTLKNLS